MPYEYEIFVSYRRSSVAGKWVTGFLLPLLKARLNEQAPFEVRVSCDTEMEAGVRYPAELQSRLRGSGLLLAIWSADYFRSAWCMAEWRSFREREDRLGYFTRERPASLVYPIRYADGEYFHPEAKLAQCRHDFSNLNYAFDGFPLTAKYMEFEDRVRQMAQELVGRLNDLPVWRPDFPVVEPDPLPPFSIARPVI
jgi:hypothetical protein